MRTKSIEAVDPEKFVQAYQAVIAGWDKPLPERGGLPFQDKDGTVRNLKLQDHPLTRSAYALLQALPDCCDQHPAMLMRVKALFQISKHPALREFVHQGETSTLVHNDLIRAAAVCPLQKTFLPNQLLRTIGSISAPTPAPERQ
jgi:hypothetical protein